MQLGNGCGARRRNALEPAGLRRLEGASLVLPGWGLALPSESWPFAAAIIACVLLLGLAVANLTRRHLWLRREAAADHERVQFLAEASGLIAASLDLETTLRTVVTKGTELLGDACVVFLCDSERAVLYPAGAFERPNTAPGQEPLGTLLARDPIPLGQGVAGHVVVRGEPLLVEDLASSPFALPRLQKVRRVRSALGVPLRVQGRVIGVLVSLYYGDRPPTANDLGAATVLADRAAVAIEHAQMHERLETLVQEQDLALRAREMQLLEAEREKAITELAAMVAHEIRNPLNVIKTAAYYVGDRLRGSDPRVDRQLWLMERHVDAAAHIIQDLMDYGALPEPNPTHVDPALLTERLARQIRAPEGVSIEVQVAPDVTTVRCDHAQIERALKNLLLNAVRAVNGAGVVCVHVTREGRRIVIEVRDNATPVTAEDAGRVFDPLFSAGTKTVGLGLAITRRIFEENGGGIDFETDEHRATIFRAWLLVAEAEADHTGAAPVEVAQAEAGALGGASADHGPGADEAAAVEGFERRRAQY